MTTALESKAALPTYARKVLDAAVGVDSWTARTTSHMYWVGTDVVDYPGVKLTLVRGDLTVTIDWETNNAGRMQRSGLYLQDTSMVTDLRYADGKAVHVYGQGVAHIPCGCAYGKTNADWATQTDVDTVLAHLRKHMRKVRAAWLADAIKTQQDAVAAAQETLDKVQAALALLQETTV